jgi:hypothetical protein
LSTFMPEIGRDVMGAGVASASQGLPCCPNARRTSSVVLRTPVLRRMLAR